MKRLIKAVLLDDEGDQHFDEYIEINNEIYGYCVNDKPTVDVCTLSFWRNSVQFYHRLAKVARFVFYVLSCSTSFEHIFSIAGMVRSKQRARLSGQIS